MSEGGRVQRIGVSPIAANGQATGQTTLEFPESYDAAWAEKCAQWLARDPQWHQHIGAVFNLMQSGVARDEGAYVRIASLLSSMRKTPRDEGFSWSTIESPGGQKLQPVRIPNIVALIDGHLPQQYRRGTAFGRVLNDVAYWWYGGDVSRMAKDAGLEVAILQGVIAGKLTLPYYDDVEAVARGLGIPMHRLDVAWFADRFRENLPTRPVIAGEKATVRAQILADIAAIRMGTPRRNVGEALAGIEQALDLARFEVNAGIPAETALPLIAGMTSNFEQFFGQISAEVERMRHEKRFDDAAMVHFLASDHFMHGRQPGLAITMAGLGADDLIMGRRYELSGVGAHYLRQALGAYEALYRHVADAARADGKKLDPRLVPHEVVVEQMRVKLSLLENARLSQRERAVTVTDGAPISGFAAPQQEKSLQEILSTAARREAFEEFQRGAPSLWREIVSSGCANAIIEEAMSFADPTEKDDAVPSMLLHGAVQKIAARMGIKVPSVPSNPEEFLVRGAITFGGFRIPLAALNPVVKGVVR